MYKFRPIRKIFRKNGIKPVENTVLFLVVVCWFIMVCYVVVIAEDAVGA